MTYSKTLDSPDFKSIIEEKWNNIRTEKISKEKKNEKMEEYVNELYKIGTIDLKLAEYILSNYRF